MAPEASSDLGVTSGAKETQGHITQHGADIGPRTDVDQAGVLAKVHILAPMASIFDAPVAPLELQQALGRPNLRWQARDAVAHLRMPCSRFLPDASVLKDLGMPRP